MAILNFGSLNTDLVYRVEHIAEPGETVFSSKLEKFCGGKGLNQSVAAARAGARVFHAGKIGADGGMLLKTLRDAGADTRYVAQTDGPGGHAVIQVDENGQNAIVVYGGANREIDGSFIDEVLSHFGPGDILLLQNEISGLAHILRAARENGLFIALNPSPFDDAVKNAPLECADLFIVNEIEGRGLSGAQNDADIPQAVREKYPRAAVLLTLGSAGAVYFDGQKTCRHGIYNVPVVDTTGAGDTFTGYFAAGLARGLGAKENLELASKASSLAVSKKGASPSIPTLDEVLAARLSML